MATDKKDDKSAPLATKVESDPATQSTERELAAMRHTRLGGPFTQDAVDVTENTAEALAARTGKPTPRDQVMKGLKKYTTTRPMYRNGIYVEAGAVIAVPEDEQPSLTWREADKDASVHFPFPPEPDTEERQKAREERQKAQERANQRAAEVMARQPAVLATAMAAREAAHPGSVSERDRERDKKK